MLANRSSVWLNLICVFFSPCMTQHQPVSSSLRNSGFAFSGHMGRGWESWGCLCWRGEGGRGTVPVCTDTWWGEWRRGSQALLSSVVPRDQAVGLLKCKKFHLNVRNVFFHCEGDQTEKQVVESPSSETFETPLLVTQPAVGDPALSRGLDQMNSGGACQLQPSCGKKNTAVWSGGGAKPANFCSLLK